MENKQAFIEEVDFALSAEGIILDDKTLDLLEELEDVEYPESEALIDDIRHRLFTRFDLIING